MDLIELGLLTGLVLAIAGLAAVIFWPMKTADDVMQQVHGDQPRRPQ